VPFREVINPSARKHEENKQRKEVELFMDRVTFSELLGKVSVHQCRVIYMLKASFGIVKKALGMAV
jgi:hypothetical protein